MKISYTCLEHQFRQIKKIFIKSWRQVCIYSFPYKSLKIYTSIKKTKLELIEDLETNRFLELGYQVKNVKNVK